MVSYDLVAAISVIPVSQSFDMLPSESIIGSVFFINAVHALRMSAHMAFMVASALTPNTDNARASKSLIVFVAVSRHCVVSVVHD